MIVRIIYTVVHAASVIILVYCVLSWFPNSRGSGFIGDCYRILGKIVNPYLNIFRKFIPPIAGSVDITPIIGMIVLEALARLILGFFF